MSIDLLRENLRKQFEARAEACTNAAISIRPRMSQENIPAMTAEEYAMFQIDRLSEARTWATAYQVLVTEIQKLTQPKDETESTQPKHKGDVY